MPPASINMHPYKFQLVDQQYKYLADRKKCGLPKQGAFVGVYQKSVDIFSAPKTNNREKMEIIN